MSVIITRKRGDNYPIVANIKVNGESIDVTASDVRFSLKPIDGSKDVVILVGDTSSAIVGEVVFNIPNLALDVAGEYRFDIQREENGIIATHLSGTLLLEDDVTP